VRVGIIDYRMGNLASVSKAFEKAGSEAYISDQPRRLESADLLVLPGVGNFAPGMHNLTELGLADLVTERAADGRPLLGICLGMQLFFEESDEGSAKGLGILPGRVERLQAEVKVPHMGWNTISAVGDSRLFEPFSEHYFYFVHSYVCVPDDHLAAAVTSYGVDFVSAVQQGATIGVQFHPEKSSNDGLSLLESLLEELG
jgi:imidazole glycerol-phosphate synthase subunit HisH